MSRTVAFWFAQVMLELVGRWASADFAGQWILVIYKVLVYPCSSGVLLMSIRFELSNFPEPFPRVQ